MEDFKYESELFIDSKHGLCAIKNIEKYLNERLFTDLEITCQEEKFSGHRVVLSASSAVFERKLQNEPNLTEVNIENIDSDIFKMLLTYMYSGSILLTKQDIDRLVLAARLLNLDILRKKCISFMEKNLSFKNWYGMKAFGDKNRLLELNDKILRYVRSNLSEIIDDPNLLYVNHEYLINVMDKNYLKAKEKFNFIVKWMAIDEERNQYLKDLLPIVDLTSMTLKFLKDVVEPHCIDSIECLRILMKAYENFQTKGLTNAETLHNILIVGGENDPIASNVDLYIVHSDQWAETQNVNLEKTDFGVELIDDEIIIVGGMRKRKALKEVNAINIRSLLITSMSPLEYNRTGLSVIKTWDDDFNVVLYAIGGKDHEEFFSIVERCHPITRVWSEVSSMKTKRAYFNSVIEGEKIYVIGGKNTDGVLNDVEVYNIATDEWESLSSMNVPRYSAAVVEYNKRLYVIGGKDYDGPVSSVEYYDIESDTWEMLNSENFPEDFKNMCAGRLENDLIVIGGRKSFRYNIDTNEWIQMEKELSSCRYGAHILPIPLHIDFPGIKRNPKSEETDE